MSIKLTQEEKQAISDLKHLSERWPKSLWLFSAAGSLAVMRTGQDGYPVFKGSGIDPDYKVADIFGIRNDGGDW